MFSLYKADKGCLCLPVVLKKWFCWQYAEFTHKQTQSAALTVVLKESILQESVPATMEGNASQTCG